MNGIDDAGKRSIESKLSQRGAAAAGNEYAVMVLLVDDQVDDRRGGPAGARRASRTSISTTAPIPAEALAVAEADAGRP